MHTNQRLVWGERSRSSVACAQPSGLPAPQLAPSKQASSCPEAVAAAAKLAHLFCASMGVPQAAPELSTAAQRQEEVQSMGGTLILSQLCCWR